MGLNDKLSEHQRRAAAKRAETIRQEAETAAAWPFSLTGQGVAGDPDVQREMLGDAKDASFGTDLTTIFSLADAYLAKVRAIAITERDRLAAFRVGTATVYTGPNGEQISGGFEGGAEMFLEPGTDFSPNAIIFTTLDGQDVTWGDLMKEASANQGTLVHPVTGQIFRFHNEMSLETLRELYRTHDAGYVGNQPQLPPIPGGGGGGGRGAPQYVRADQLLVEEVVKGYVVATTGKIHQDLIDQGIATFNEKHRLGWDLRESQEVDPMAAVKDQVRADRRYTGPHTLRPESVDELEWIGQRQRALSAFGVASGKEEQLGIDLATMGAGGSGVRGVAESQIFADSGRLAKSQRDQLVSRASVAMRLI
jgi:hypothetical protein